MADFRVKGYELQLKSGKKIGSIKKDVIRDSTVKKIGMMRGNDIRDANNHKIALIKGMDIRDPNNKKIANINEIKNEIENAVGGASVAARWLFFIR